MLLTICSVQPKDTSLLPGLAVDRLTDQIGMSEVASMLLNEVNKDPPKAVQAPLGSLDIVKACGAKSLIRSSRLAP
jgi:hypothetical protein